MVEILNIEKGLFLGILDLNQFSAHSNLSAKRDIESHGKNYLIQKLVNETVYIGYNDNGKPYLINDSRHISISHSHDKLVIIVNEKESTGVDIELIRNKVLKIKHKFLSETELAHAGNDIEKLLIYWGAKETLYKIYGMKGVDFRENLFVKPFNNHTFGTLMGIINMPEFKESFNLIYQVFDNYVLVYAKNKIVVC